MIGRDHEDNSIVDDFGGQFDWLVAADPGGQVAGGQPVVQTPVTVTSTQHLQSLNYPPSDLTSPKVASNF